MAYFATNDGDLTNVFLNDSDLLDQSLQGSIFATGGNIIYGQLGDNTTTSKSFPTLVIGGNTWRQISSGAQSSAGIKSDGSLWLWGRGQNGQLGQGTGNISRSSPVQTVTASRDWKTVSVGGGSVTTMVAAIKTDGTLWTWGGNSNGKLGDNSSTGKSSPVQTVTGGNNWKDVSTISECTLALKTDGTLWTWGGNGFGQLGNNNFSISAVSSPIQTIAGGSDWAKIGQSAQLCNTCAAIKTNGTLWLWGDNSYGNLGDNAGLVWKSSPVQTVAGGNNWKFVACGPNSTAAIKTDGTLWTWGENSWGLLADNTTVNKSSPIQTVAGGTNWKFVSVGDAVAAIKTDGTLWLWGDNQTGELGDGNSSTNRSSPIQTAAGGSYWISASTKAGTHTLLLTSL